MATNIPVAILAAGKATRLKPYSDQAPKFMMELEPGVTILDFIIERLKSLGITKIFIVARPEYTQTLRDKFGDEVEILETELETFENLYSMGLAAEKIKGKFLVLMSDHIFTRDLLKTVLNRIDSVKEAFLVCLDREPSLASAEEGLKLKLDDMDHGKVVEVGKSLAPIYGIDTGVIFCNKSARKYIRKALKQKGPNAKIKDALNLAAADGQVGFVDVTGFLWKDVDTLQDLEKARDLYWRILKEELVRPTDGVISRYLNRPISSTFSLMLYRKRIFISPNIISALSFFIALAGSIFLAIRWFLIGGILVQASSIIDGIDGELARLFKRTSKFGGLLDSLLDRLADLSIILGLALALWPLNVFTALIVILASANTILVSYVTHLLKSARIDPDAIRSIPVTRDVRLFVIFLMAILGFPELALYYIAFAPFAYYVAGVYIARKAAMDDLQPSVKAMGAPWPEIPLEKNIVKQTLSELMGKLLRLIIALLILRLVEPILSDVTLISLEDAALTSSDVFIVIETSLIIYFGYAILLSIKRLADVIAVRLATRVGVTKETFKRLLIDIIYAILSLIVWIYATDLARISLIGDVLSKVVMTVAAVFFFITLYRIGKRTYHVFASIYDRLIERLAKKLNHPTP